jgi:hypothetical protein
LAYNAASELREQILFVVKDYLTVGNLIVITRGSRGRS